MNELVLGATAFVACAVEMVEAATIVLAVGVAHRRAAAYGTIGAVVALATLIALFGPLMTREAVVQRVELVAGPLVVLLGIAWLRKAIWRYAGRKAMRDEDAAYAREVTKLRNSDETHAMAAAFSGVFVEGLEVVIIVVAFAAGNADALKPAAAGALLALIAVTIAAWMLRKPFSAVPENLLKFIVGTMLLSIGTFWTGEAFGVGWWLGDATLGVIAIAYLIVALVLIRVHAARSV